MRIIPFAPGHLEALDLQPQQEIYRPYLGPDVADSLPCETSWSAVQEGSVFCCAGLQPVWRGRAVAWALFSNRFATHWFPRLHRYTRSVLDDAQARGLWRIETQIDPEFPQAVRWAELLGFEFEGLMRQYLPDGRDMYLVARIRKC